MNGMKLFGIGRYFSMDNDNGEHWFRQLARKR
jgi:hypothetical protein